MAQTTVATTSALAVQRFTSMLAVDIARDAYWNSKFMSSGKSPTMPIWRLTDLEKMRGASVDFHLSMQLRGKPVQGNQKADGTAEQLDTYSDLVYIDQLRKVVSAGNKNDQQKTMLEFREIGRARQSEYMIRLFDETITMYLSGSRGDNDDFIESTDFTGYAGNAFVAPDSYHLMYGGEATDKTNLTADDKFSLKLIDRAIAKAKRQGGGTTRIPKLQAPKVNGKKRFLCVMDPIQEFDLRREQGDLGWAQITKALAQGSNGAESNYTKDALGIYRDVVLQVHEGTIRFNSYGANSDVPAARALFCGIQAGVIALGQPGSANTFTWEEEWKDFKYVLEICTGTRWGVKKVTFNGLDFGVFSMDTAADPASVN
jgi:N4-gp56 family major capsid protein